MTINEFPRFVINVLNEVMAERVTQSIWFIGSRANGCEKSDSDWDFIVFINNAIQERSVRHGKVDIIQVSPDGRYLLEGQEMDMIGKFSTWKWLEIEPELARYTVRKVPNVESDEGFDLDKVKLVSMQGLKVWERN